MPPQVLTIITELDDSQEKLQPQKAATPCDGMLDITQAGETFAKQLPRAAVPEGSSPQDPTTTAIAALQELEEGLKTANQRSNMQQQNMEIRTGNILVDQFQPYYFAVAFCFCFQYATACPDVANTTMPNDQRKSRRKERDPQAPSLQIFEWAASIQRRVETQFRRDWNFGFTLWNYIFRTMVNTAGNSYLFTTENSETGKQRPLTNKEISDGVAEVNKHLFDGTYTDINGNKKYINGDLTKLWHVQSLSAAAKRVISNLDARTRNIPGTHQIRKTMRHQTHANRICYGTPIFLTFSPSERDSAIMLRLVRARSDDPAVQADQAKHSYQRTSPPLDVDFAELDLEDLARAPWNIWRF